MQKQSLIARIKELHQRHSFLVLKAGVSQKRFDRLLEYACDEASIEELVALYDYINNSPWEEARKVWENPMLTPEIWEFSEMMGFIDLPQFKLLYEAFNRIRRYYATTKIPKPKSYQSHAREGSVRSKDTGSDENHS